MSWFFFKQGEIDVSVVQDRRQVAPAAQDAVCRVSAALDRCQLARVPKCLSISAAFSRIIASCIAFARSSPSGMFRALSRASDALTSSLQVRDG